MIITDAVKSVGRKWLVVVAAAVLIAASGLALGTYESGDSGTSLTSRSFVILPSGNVTSLGGTTGGFTNFAKGVEFLVSTNATVTGQFTATGNVTVYILDPIQFGNMPQYESGLPYSCPQLCPPYFVLKDTTSGTKYAQLAPGRYWLAFVIVSNSVLTSVTITQSVTATGVGRICPTPDC